MLRIKCGQVERKAQLRYKDLTKLTMLKRDQKPLKSDAPVYRVATVMEPRLPGGGAAHS